MVFQYSILAENHIIFYHIFMIFISHFVSFFSIRTISYKNIILNEWAENKLWYFLLFFMVFQYNILAEKQIIFYHILSLKKYDKIWYFIAPKNIIFWSYFDHIFVPFFPMWIFSSLQVPCIIKFSYLKFNV